jgi:16S rRNA (adenine1518-N6/adenine1519-N6)-dimethyltransferase
MHPKQLLAQYGLEPKKSLGQNFLFDENVLARIAATADLHPHDQVLEVGPGLGALTRHLAQAAARVAAVELDARFLPILRDQLAPFANVQIIHGDILEQDPAALFEGPYKVVANVPYYITGAILRHLLGARHKPTCLALTVQQEVAERITAVPPNMSLLAVSVQFYGRAVVAHTIKAGAFWPRPDVDSAVVRIDVNEDLTRVDEAAFFHVARAGFSQKRKQLQNNLRRLGLDKRAVQAALDAAGIDGRRRAETLTIEEWLTLTKVMRSA